MHRNISNDIRSLGDVLHQPPRKRKARAWQPVESVLLCPICCAPQYCTAMDKASSEAILRCGHRRLQRLQ
jgi:hypothetical protein